MRILFANRAVENRVRVLLAMGSAWTQARSTDAKGHHACSELMKEGLLERRGSFGSGEAPYYRLTAKGQRTQDLLATLFA